jgi:hypothetical protein
MHQLLPYPESVAYGPLYSAILEIEILSSLLNGSE